MRNVRNDEYAGFFQKPDPEIPRGLTPLKQLEWCFGYLINEEDPLSIPMELSTESNRGTDYWADYVVITFKNTEQTDQMLTNLNNFRDSRPYTFPRGYLLISRDNNCCLMIQSNIYDALSLASPFSSASLFFRQKNPFEALKTELKKEFKKQALAASATEETPLLGETQTRCPPCLIL